MDVEKSGPKKAGKPELSEPQIVMVLSQCTEKHK